MIIAEDAVRVNRARAHIAPPFALSPARAGTPRGASVATATATGFFVRIAAPPICLTKVNRGAIGRVASTTSEQPAVPAEVGR
jgi:hypothetical protein